MAERQTPPHSQGFALPQGFRGWSYFAVVIWGVLGFGLILNGLHQVANIVLPSLTSFFIAGALLAIFRPVTRALKARGFNDALAAIAGVLAALACIGVLSALFLGPVVSGAAGVLTAIPTAAANITAKLQQAIANYQKLPAPAKQTFQAVLGGLTSHVSDFAASGVGMLVSGLSALFSLGLEMFLAFILMFWFLKDGPHIAKATLNVVPHRYREDIAVMAHSFDKSFSGYLLATAINCSIIFVLDGLGFTIVRLPNAWFIASLVAILGIIPYLGSILSFVVAVIVGLAISPTIGVATGIIVFAVDQIVYSFIGPIVAGKTVTLHPVMIIFSLSIGASLAGFLGAILSIPVAAAIRVIYLYYHERDEAAEKAGSSPPSHTPIPAAEES